jgi:uncharacterized protein YyaL (SSP411 family)
LAELTTEDGYRFRSERTLEAFHGRLEKAPAALSEILLAVDFHLDAPKEVIIVTPRSRAEAEPFLEKLRTTYLPNRILAIATVGADLDRQAATVRLLRQKAAQRGTATAFVCEAGVCKLPTTDPSVFADQIREVKPLFGKPGAPP